MTSKLTGTVVIVTGASSGIGEATAKELASLGATVAVIARRKDRLDTLVTEIEQDGGTALAVEVDITDRVGRMLQCKPSSTGPDAWTFSSTTRGTPLLEAFISIPSLLHQWKSPPPPL